MLSHSGRCPGCPGPSARQIRLHEPGDGLPRYGALQGFTSSYLFGRAPAPGLAGHVPEQLRRFLADFAAPLAEDE